MVNKITAKTKQQNTAQFWSTITILGVAAYIVIDVVLAFLRPDYSLLHNAESDYDRGSYFWLMDINFLLRCLLSLALVKAIFVTFPKNKSIKHASYWLAIWAVMSGLLAFFAFIAVSIAMVLVSRITYKMETRRFSSFLLIGLTGIAIVSLLLLGHAAHVFYLHSLGGLYERIFLASVLVWELVLALSLKTVND